MSGIETPSLFAPFSGRKKRREGEVPKVKNDRPWEDSSLNKKMCIRDRLNASYGLDKPIVLGFVTWVGDALKGNFGDSWKYTVPVLDLSLIHI